MFKHDTDSIASTSGTLALSSYFIRFMVADHPPESTLLILSPFKCTDRRHPLQVFREILYTFGAIDFLVDSLQNGGWHALETRGNNDGTES